MSGRTYHYLLYYLSVSAILVHGSSRRIPRGASCPSCSQDCPEALVNPRYPYRESRPQFGSLQDFSITPFRNPSYFHLAQGGISWNVDRDDILSNQKLIPYREFNSFPQQGFANRNLYTSILPSTQSLNKLKHQDLYFENFPNNFAEASGRQTILSQDKYARQLFDKSGHKNTFFRSPRNKYSISSSEDHEFEGSMDTQAREDPASKLLIVYRADREPSWKDSRYTSLPNVVLPQRSLANFRREDIPDEERNTIKKSPNLTNQRHDLAFPQEKYYPAKVNVPKIKHDSYVLAEDFDIRKPMKDEEFFNNWDLAGNSLETLNLEQLEPAQDNFFEIDPAEEKEMIINEGNIEQINYDPRISSRYLDTLKPTKDENHVDAWNSVASKDSQKLQEDGRFKETGNNWSRLYRSMEKEIRFENEEKRNKEYLVDEENENQKYFEDMIKENFKAGVIIYNPYALPQNMNILKGMQDKELFTMHKNPQEVQQTEKLKIYPMEYNNNNNFRNEEGDDKTQDETHANTNGIIRPSVIDFNPYVFPGFLNILNAAKYPIESLKTKESPETKNNILHLNPVEKERRKEFDRFYKDEITDKDDTHIQDMISPKNSFSGKRHNLAAITKPDTRNYAQEEALTKLDPDLIDDIEDPPAEPTESTPTESVLFTSKQQ